MKYARVIETIVAETFVPPAGFEIQDCFTPEIVAQFEPCPEEVEQGWIKREDGVFVPPPEPEPPIPGELPIPEA